MADYHQEPDIAKGKGTVVNFKDCNFHSSYILEYEIWRHIICDWRKSTTYDYKTSKFITKIDPSEFIFAIGGLQNSSHSHLWAISRVHSVSLRLRVNTTQHKISALQSCDQFPSHRYAPTPHLCAQTIANSIPYPSTRMFNITHPYVLKAYL